MKNLPVRAASLCALVTVFGGVSAAQTRQVDTLLPPASLARLPSANELTKKILGTEGTERSDRLWLLINPQFADTVSARSTVRSWEIAGGFELPEKAKSELTKVDRAYNDRTLLDVGLRNVMREFFQHFIGRLEWMYPDLNEAIRSNSTVTSPVVAAADVKCRMNSGLTNRESPETGAQTLTVEVSLQLLRLTMGTSDQANEIPPIQRMERIFMARATGDAAVASEDAGGLRKAYEAAIWKALEHQIAVFLWCQPRLVENAWNHPRTAVKLDAR